MGARLARSGEERWIEVAFDADLKIRKLTPAIGAEVTGLDLSGPLGQETLDSVYDALIEHHVVFIPAQALSVANHLAFAKSFGEPQPPHPVYPHHPESEHVVVLHNGPDNPPDTDGWHSDVSFQQVPPFPPSCGPDRCQRLVAIRCGHR